MWGLNANYWKCFVKFFVYCLMGIATFKICLGAKIVTYCAVWPGQSF